MRAKSNHKLPAQSDAPSSDLETVNQKSDALVGINEVTPMNQVSERKIEGVSYKVSYPDPAKTVLTPEQVAQAVKAYFTIRTAYLLRTDVKNESATLEVNRKLLSSMVEMALTLGASPEVAQEKAMEYLTGRDANFRTAGSTEYTYTLDNIFVTEKPEDATENPS